MDQDRIELPTFTLFFYFVNTNNLECAALTNWATSPINFLLSEWDLNPRCIAAYLIRVVSVTARVPLNIVVQMGFEPIFEIISTTSYDSTRYKLASVLHYNDCGRKSGWLTDIAFGYISILGGKFGEFGPQWITSS